jgi:hypothetical protein
MVKVAGLNIMDQDLTSRWAALIVKPRDSLTSTWVLIASGLKFLSCGRKKTLNYQKQLLRFPITRKERQVSETNRILIEIANEREHQKDKWGVLHDDHHSEEEWFGFIFERVRNCVRPDHLEPVTQRENVLRGVGTAATHAKQTHCEHGHEFTPEHTIIRRNGSRECRPCKQDRDALRYQAKVGSRPIRFRKSKVYSRTTSSLEGEK